VSPSPPTMPTTARVPCARLALPRRTFGHSTVVFDGHVYVYGGRDAQCHSNELNVLPLHIHPLVWRTIPPTESTPSPRRQHTAAMDRRGRMHVVGGGFLAASGERIYRSDAHAFDTRSQSWHATPPPPHGWSCMAHSCVHVPSWPRQSTSDARDSAPRRVDARDGAHRRVDARDGAPRRAGARDGGTAHDGAPDGTRDDARDGARADAHDGACAHDGHEDETEDETDENEDETDETDRGMAIAGGAEALVVFGGLTTVWRENPAPPHAAGPARIERPLVNNALLCLDVGGAVLDAPWRRLRPTGAPPDPRFRHSATLAGSALDPTMAVWGGFRVRPQVDEPQVDEPDDLDDLGAPIDEPDDLDTPIQTPWDQCCSNELYLLHLGDLRWSSPALRGPLPSPRGGHSATLIGATLVIVGGCDGGEQGVPRDDELFLERDLSNVVLLDLARLTYVATEPVVCSFEPRSGHSAVLVPCDGGLGLLVLGGRDYRPPQFPWDEGEHHGRALVDRLALTLKPS
jgi:hypothetical protein